MCDFHDLVEPPPSLLGPAASLVLHCAQLGPPVLMQKCPFIQAGTPSGGTSLACAALVTYGNGQARKQS